jgi:hypothetical protein
VVTAGGSELEVAFRKSGEDYDVSLTGPAEVAFAGSWPEPSMAPGSVPVAGA